MKRLFLVILVSFGFIPAMAWSYDSRYVETYTQYAPMAADVCLGLCGVPSRDGIVFRTASLGLALGCESVVVNLLLKNVVNEERPDGRSFDSFPSGHTALAFVGAELVRKEYGWGWGAGAYAVAASVGVMRVCHQRHWWWDVCAGAGIGVLCANAGSLLSGPVLNLLGIGDTRIALVPYVDPVSGTMCTSLRYKF